MARKQKAIYSLIDSSIKKDLINNWNNPGVVFIPSNGLEELMNNQRELFNNNAKIRCIASLENYYEKARELFPHFRTRVYLHLNMRNNSQRAGDASHKYYKDKFYSNIGLIRLNPFFLDHNYPAICDDMIEETVPHEFAHIMARNLFPNCTAHGGHWKLIMKLLGKKPSRCHQYYSDMQTIDAQRNAK